MSHKFKVGDKVEVDFFVEGRDLPPDICISVSKLPGVITSTRPFAMKSNVHFGLENIYEVKVGQVYYHVQEDGLEKIEEPEIEPKYKIGDRVVFHPDENQDCSEIGTIIEVKEGEYKDIYEYRIRNVVNLNLGTIGTRWVKQVWINCLYVQSKAEPKYKIGDVVNFNIIYKNNLDSAQSIKGEIEHITEKFYTIHTPAGYSFTVTEEDIIGLYLPEEFKKGDEVWVRAKVNKELDKDGDLIIELNSKFNLECFVKPHQLFKSIPPKNEWISIKDRLPRLGANVHIFTKKNVQQVVTVTEGKWFYEYVFWSAGIPYLLDEITHWKPLDEPPTEQG